MDYNSYYGSVSDYSQATPWWAVLEAVLIIAIFILGIIMICKFFSLCKDVKSLTSLTSDNKTGNEWVKQFATGNPDKAADILINQLYNSMLREYLYNTYKTMSDEERRKHYQALIDAKKKQLAFIGSDRQIPQPLSSPEAFLAWREKFDIDMTHFQL